MLPTIVIIGHLEIIKILLDYIENENNLSQGSIFMKNTRFVTVLQRARSSILTPLLSGILAGDQNVKFLVGQIALIMCRVGPMIGNSTFLLWGRQKSVYIMPL